MSRGRSFSWTEAPRRRSDPRDGPAPPGTTMGSEPLHRISRARPVWIVFRTSAKRSVIGAIAMIRHPDGPIAPRTPDPAMVTRPKSPQRADGMLVAFAEFGDSREKDHCGDPANASDPARQTYGGCWLGTAGFTGGWQSARICLAPDLQRKFSAGTKQLSGACMIRGPVERIGRPTQTGICKPAPSRRSEAFAPTLHDTVLAEGGGIDSTGRARARNRAMLDRAITTLTSILRPRVSLSNSRSETLCLLVIGMSARVRSISATSPANVPARRRPEASISKTHASPICGNSTASLHSRPSRSPRPGARPPTSSSTARPQKAAWILRKVLAPNRLRPHKKTSPIRPTRSNHPLDKNCSTCTRKKECRVV